MIGAGLAGLACARDLQAAGLAVRLFDKGRAAGGRLATRRAEAAGARLQFDHGAQYVRAEGAELAATLAELGARAWPDEGRVVGVPGMSALARRLAEGLSLTTGRHALALAGVPGEWRVRHADAARVRPGAAVPEHELAEDGPFTAAVVAVPAPQAIPLLAPHAPGFAAALEAVRFAPCWTVMAAFPGRLALGDTLRPAASPIGWAARDSSKPGRDGLAECWVVQATPAWTREHLEDPPARVIDELLAALAELAGPLPAPIHREAHRWRYALVETPLGSPCLWDPSARLGVAGDGCIAGRAEAAWDSGRALARAILRA